MVIIGYEGTCCVVGEWCAEVAVVVADSNSLLSYGFTTFVGHIGEDIRKNMLQDGDFVWVDRGTAVAIDTALTFAVLKVAGEAAVGDVVGDDGVLYDEH